MQQAKFPMKAALIGLLAGLALGGCETSWYDWRVFDDLADTTWADSSTVPDELNSTEYASSLSSGGLSNEGARFFVAGREPDGFGWVHYANSGDLQVQGIPLTDVNTLDQVNDMPASPVMIPDPNSADMAVALSNGGSPDVPNQATVAFVSANNGATGNLFSLLGPELIVDMAIGSTDVAGGGLQNLVALRGTVLAVINDISDTNSTIVSCTLDAQVGVAVAMADFDTTTPGDEIALGVTVDGGSPAVHIVQGTMVENNDTTLCSTNGPAPLLTIAPPGGETEFGRHLVVGNFNDDPAPDLAISSPAEDIVYVYFDIDGGSTQSTSITGPVIGNQFGSVLTAGDLDGDGRDELIISAPDESVGGESGAGAIYLYDLSTDPATELAKLHDAQPEASQAYGQAVAVVPFGDDQHILVVGASNEVITYFQTPISGDVRPSSN